MRSIDALLNDSVAAGDAVGLSAVVVDGARVRYLGSAGWRDQDRGTPMSPDTIVRIASMTKAVTSVAAMQEVERGALSLDGPIDEVLPVLHEAPVLDGYDGDGAPVLRPASRPITLRHLLTHTAGFAYPTWNAALFEFSARAPHVRPIDGADRRLSLPLVFDPGDRWEYGTNTDWAGFAVEAARGQRLGEVMRERIFEPLGMHDTAFEPLDPSRLASVYRRGANGVFARLGERDVPIPAYHGGGGGLFSTAADYGLFLRALLGASDATLVDPETLALMRSNHIGSLVAGQMPAFETERSNVVSVLPGAGPTWSLYGLRNTVALPGGRAAGSVCWGGLFNSFYWVDGVNQVAGAIFAQLLPFYDARVIDLYERFEQLVYAQR